MTTPPIHVQIATAGDLPRLLRMMQAFNQLEGITYNPATTAEAAERLVGDPALGVVGFIRDGHEVIGYFVVTWGFDLEWGGRDSFLTELYIEPAARGRGFGTLAMALIEELARANGAAALHLMARVDNAPALALYRKAGYVTPERVFFTKPLR